MAEAHPITSSQPLTAEFKNCEDGWLEIHDIFGSQDMFVQISYITSFWVDNHFYDVDE